MTPEPPSAATKLQKLREGFIRQLPAQIGAIRERLSALDEAAPPKQELEELHRSIHTLKGSSASFGLKGLSAVAKEGEALAKILMTGGLAPGSPWRATMEDLLVRMERALAANDSGQEENAQPVMLDAAAVEAIHSGKERKRVYLCDDDPFQLSSLTTQIGCFGFDVSAFSSLEQFLAAVETSAPDVIVMDMIHPDSKTGGAQAVQKLRAGEGTRIPVVYVSSDSGLESRLAAVRAGCDAYFVKPINPNILSSTLHALTTSEKPERNRVLIVDDDQHTSEMYALTLHGAGMEPLVVNDPMQTLTHLYAFKPDLILMDMHMPGCNGMELASAIRQIEAYISIPIVFLSSETDQGMQADARRMGGDEFLVKPIKPEHLISAVAVRAERMKLLRSYMIRDSMTGLFNHSTIKEYLELNVEQAQRAEKNVCFAMVDLDHFKGVNDRYGHPAGDRVLLVLANLLQQRLRKSDVVGRYGGEEFAIILPECSMAEAVTLMNQLRQCFENIRFPVNGDFFTVTMSCGVASLESHDNAEKLCLAADQALYQAKKGGRNLVVAAARFFSKAQLRELTVLVVDDAPPIRAILNNMLETIGFANILEATNGLEAWDMLKLSKVDLVITDWHMPKMTGLELLKAVRADADLKALPFMMLTSECDKNSVREAILAGVSEYLLKPVLSEELSKKIIRALCKDKATVQPAAQPRQP